jgi:hypothetical protein
LLATDLDHLKLGRAEPRDAWPTQRWDGSSDGSLARRDAGSQGRDTNTPFRRRAAGTAGKSRPPGPETLGPVIRAPRPAVEATVVSADPKEGGRP